VSEPERSKLPIAVRAYPESQNAKANFAKQLKGWRRPDSMFVFDTETRTDATQSLIFGCYRFIQKGHCLEEGLFYADNISDDEQVQLQNYVSVHNSNGTLGNNTKLLLLTRNEFLEKIFRAVYKGRCLLVGFNLPFDLSRVASEATFARGRFKGGFSLGLSSYVDDNGDSRRNQFRPRVGIKHIDSKRALKGFTARNNPDREDLIPDESNDEEPEKERTFRGHFLDLRTLAFALTDRGYSLESACEAFGVKNGKQKVTVHGIVTDEYIGYNRQDVAATAELAEKLLEEYDKHPIKLQETKAYSPASIGKAYLQAMGIEPILQRQPDFPKRLLGYAQSAFFGGRTSVHIRKVTVPVVYTDFLSMYPTVNSLMGLWNFVIAEEIKCVENCSNEIRTFLTALQPDALFIPDTWPKLTAFVKVIPNGDILPARAKYSTESNDWQVGINHLYADKDSTPSNALWFTLPDVVVSTLLTGRVPEIVDAFRIEPRGVSPTLQTVKLRGEIAIEPGAKDFFRTVIEQRKRLPSRSDLDERERDRLDKALKVLANATSYGIYAEMNVQEGEEKQPMTCYGIDEEPFRCAVTNAEQPGKYCFPPFAALITGAARLMLALLEHTVTAMGGTYAMEDTDSMAIVATENGGPVACKGGPRRTKHRQAAVTALSWRQVKEIEDRFSSLNPYDREFIPGSVLKIEDVNFDPVSGVQRQVFCFAISAKRYTLFLKDENGAPLPLKKDVNSKDNGWKDHGLGHLLNPSDLDEADRNWTGDVWLDIVGRSLGFPAKPLSFANLPAVGRVTVSSPAVMKPLADFNSGKPYEQQIKPFNFLLTAQTNPFGHPAGADPTRFHLIAPYELNPKNWLQVPWLDQYSGEQYGITTDGHTGGYRTARVKTYADVLCEYEYHPESKCADTKGRTCEKQTVGLLQRRHIEIDRLVYIGKESNRLEEVEAGTVLDEDEVYTEYVDPSRDEWATKILPVLQRMKLTELIKLVPQMSRRALVELRAGRSRPHPKNAELIRRIVYDYLEQRHK
jgi:DNA polymerase III epsilon subunit-like protein